MRKIFVLADSKTIIVTIIKMKIKISKLLFKERSHQCAEFTNRPINFNPIVFRRNVMITHLKRTFARLALLLPLMALNVLAVTTSPRSLQLVTGEATRVTLSNISGSVAVSNSNTAAVSASLSGRTISVTAAAPGSAILSVRDSRGTATVTVTVKPPMTVTPESLSLVEGGSASVQINNPFSAVSLGNSATNKVMASLKNNVITVTGRAAGKATLTIRDTKTTKTIVVQVSSAPPMTITPESLSLVVGGSATVQVNNSFGAVSLGNSDTGKVMAFLKNNIVTVTGKAAGKATLTIRDSRTTKTIVVQVASTPTVGMVTGVTTGRLLASNCFQCHGTYGSGGFEKVLRKSESELLSELNEYASGQKDPDDIMAAHARGYTPEQLQAIAKYLANP